MEHTVLKQFVTENTVLTLFKELNPFCLSQKEMYVLGYSETVYRHSLVNFL